MDEKKLSRATPINTNRKTGKRMRPVLVAMLDENTSIAELADKMGMSRSSLNRWFQIDDAKLSGLDEMAKAMGYHIEWKMVKD